MILDNTYLHVGLVITVVLLIVIAVKINNSYKRDWGCNYGDKKKWK